jgi:hypothetical protein
MMFVRMVWVFCIVVVVAFGVVCISAGVSLVMLVFDFSMCGPAIPQFATGMTSYR